MVSKGNKTNSNTNKGVRDRLLDAAEELFCEQGFEGASVRDIAAAAKCNIASVNYYFGGKEKLYQEVWRRHLITMRDTRIASIDKVMSQNDGKPHLEDLLKSFAEAFLGLLVDESRARRFCKLMAREMIDQHLPVNMFVDNIITPTLAAMRGALVKACPGLDESKVPFIVFSIVGQLLHVLHVKAIFQQIDATALPKFDLAQAVDHVVKFSTAGIRVYVEEKSE
ncbi:MAG: CerR family C-terminal domain-containing protein [Planctomycetes bacterium]|nr:CerR family C-terminal domain-containing protein [Planctomycetota bacterium]